MKKAALYVRVSTEEQKLNGISIDDQITALKKYANEHGYKIVGVYNDAGISGKTGYKKRPDMARLLEDCKAGKVDLILFTKLDRWFRSVQEYYQVQAVLDLNNVKWMAIWEDYENETSSGVFKVNIMLSVAQNETDKSSERSKAAKRYLRSRNMWTGGSAPLGYKWVDKKIVIDEEMQPHVKQFFTIYANTHSAFKCMDYMLAQGIKCPVSKAYWMLHNPSYYGSYPDMPCEPYITKEQFDENQKHCCSHTRSKNRTYLFSGIAVCGYCGYKLAGHTRKYKSPIGNDKELFDYRCVGRAQRINNCKGLFIPEKRLEEWMLANFGIEHEKAVVEMEHVEYEDDHTDEIEKLQKRIERIGDRYELGDLSKNEYIKKRQALMDEIEMLKPKEKREIPKLPDTWIDIYNDLTRENKREFWIRSCKKIYVTKEEIRVEI